jgi:hypothetical protein
MNRIFIIARALATAALLAIAGGAQAGLNAPGGLELASTVIAGNFVATGNSSTTRFIGQFNVSLWGTFSGTVILERSFDGGTTFLPLPTDTIGTANAYTVPVTLVVNEPEPGAIYRLRCSAYVSGTINYRMASGPGLT